MRKHEAHHAPPPIHQYQIVGLYLPVGLVCSILFFLFPFPSLLSPPSRETAD